jgi:hypothetical protein
VQVPSRPYESCVQAPLSLGSSDTAMLYISDMLPFEERPKLDEVHPIKVSTHISQAAGVLLSVVTELQAYFHFDDNGARINERIHEVWNALLPTFTVKELYDERYVQLMTDEGLNP